MKKQPKKNKQIAFAYSSIHNFFDYYALANAICSWQSILLAATRRHPYNKEAPYYALLFMRQLSILMDAGAAIYKANAIKPDAILRNGMDDACKGSLQPVHFVPALQTNNAWNSLPRHLTAKQYCNPYKALKKFTCCIPLTNAKNTLQQILEYALGNTVIDEVLPARQLLRINLLVLQLLEACNLIEVRTYKKSI